MKKLSWLLVLTMVLSMFAVTASAEGDYAQAPMFDEAVEAGTLPPVEERLPENPRVAKEILDEYLDMEIGNYGGTIRLVTSVVNWDADGFIGQNEALLTMESANSAVITPNIVEAFEANEDSTVFTFKLRKGLKWSDGTEVTMEDFRFGIEDFVFNEELTPSIPAYMRDGGVGSGAPFTFEVIDDETFTITFGSSYGGFAVHLSIAGWKGYTDLLKPAHFLKQFHKDYAEEIHGSLEAYYEFMQPFSDAAGLGDVTAEGVWVDVFNQLDCTNWELTDPRDQMTSSFFPGLIEENFPVLYGWVMTSSEGGVTTWERNPYYFKVDEDGNQLPYIDYITSTLVEDMQMVQMKYMSGEADFGRESATIDNISLYRENEEKAGITAYNTNMHNTPTDIALNVNYGLNVDGTVKDDDESKAWQEVIGLKDFRHALAIAIDAEELIDTVYNGFAEAYEPHGCTHDIDGAKALLDGIGMVDVDGDGYRETPSGLPFQFQIWNSAEANDIIPASEMYVEFWKEIGIKASVYTTESTLRDTSVQANEVPCRVSWVHETQLWHYSDWFESQWAPLFDDWFIAGGLAGEAGAEGLLAPPEDIQQFHKDVQALFTVDPETAVNEMLPKLADFMAENQYLIIPITNVQQCVIINSDIGNVPEGGVGISWNFAFEQFFYED
jgi:peptide/nickel transport system substrate-binding protein